MNAALRDVSTTTLSFPSANSRDALAVVLRGGAQRLSAEAVEAEVRAGIDLQARDTDAAGRRQVVRNGYLPKRSILTGIGRWRRESVQWWTELLLDVKARGLTIEPQLTTGDGALGV